MLKDLVREVIDQMQDDVAEDRRTVLDWIRDCLPHVHSDHRSIAMALVYASRPQAPAYLLHELARILELPTSRHENLDAHGRLALVGFVLHCFGFEMTLLRSVTRQQNGSGATTVPVPLPSSLPLPLPPPLPVSLFAVPSGGPVAMPPPGPAAGPVGDGGAAAGA